MCSGGAPPKDQQVSLATALQRSCVTFCIACHALTAAAGPSLKDSLTKLAQNMVNPCLALLKDMVSPLSASAFLVCCQLHSFSHTYTACSCKYVVASRLAVAAGPVGCSTGLLASMTSKPTRAPAAIDEAAVCWILAYSC